MKKYLLVSTALLLSACSGLSPSEKTLNKKILDLNNSTLSSASGYDERIASFSGDQANIIAVYRESGKWDEEAAKLLSEARTQKDTYKRGLKDASKSSTVQSYLDKEFDEVKSLRDRVQEFNSRPHNILKIGSDYESYVNQSQSNYDDILKLYQVSDNARKKSLKEFSQRSDEINKRFSYIESNLEKSKNALSYLKYGDGSGNLLESYNNIMLIESNLFDLKKYSEKYVSDLKALSKDYTLVLTDMKAEYYVMIAYQTWDNWADYGGEGPVYKIEYQAVSASDYEYLVARENIAKINGKGVVSPTIDKNVFSRVFNIRPKIDRSHDEGVVWIEDFEPRYYHKYVEISGSKKSNPKWEEVDESDYALHLDNFGMAIESKAVGQFPDEAIEEPIPVGMDKVGNENYGEWRQDSSGNSFWHYYGQYAFISSMLDGHRYSRYDYDNYGSWRERRYSGSGNYGYYGTNRSSPTFGSRGSVTMRNASYRSSPFSRSGGYKSTPSSLRNKSQQIRARGPKGGGK